MLIRDFKIEFNQANVFHQIDCYQGSELYEEVLEEYRQMEEEMPALCDPVFIMEYGVIGPELAREGIPEGTPVLMVITSIGAGMSKYSTQCFTEGDYLRGMLADAMADSALFSLAKQYVPYLKEECGRLGMGIRRRLEAPHDISMMVQKVVLEKTKARELYGMGISSGYMLDPVKSNAEIYILTNDKEIFMNQHNCRNCDRYDCQGRNIPDIPVKVIEGEKTYTLMVKEKESILDALMAKDASFTAVCGGTGKCGKCKIKVLDGYLPVTPSDTRHFTEDELKDGMRISCRAYPTEPIQIEIKFKEESAFQVLTEYEQSETQEVIYSEDDTFGIAIDIGTTTIAMQLLSMESGNVLASFSTINHQRSYGADVISRILASVGGKKEELQRSICQDLVKGIRQLTAKAGVEPGRIKEVIIAGNTTMGHLLMGYDCKGLGEYPFTPVNIKQITDTYSNLLADDFLEATVHLMPGISTFVGGDIAAGLYACDVDQKEEYALLIDLGTNGEIALGNKNKIMVTSTAAGPAFEGGNITFGVGSIEGAISGVVIEGGQVNIKTIGDKAPVGICGTGVLEAVAELLKADLADETGCLADDYFDDGFLLATAEDGTEIVINQQDIREIQLAKAAVRGGIETLFLRYGISKEEVSKVYLAGGFGFKLDCQKAIEIGMIPEVFGDKIEAVGNSSLGGAVKFLLSEEERERVRCIGDNAEEINLSADKDFNQFYMDYMYFEKV